MREVTAYEDNRGKLHKSALTAVEEDFILAMNRAWACLPSDPGIGDPSVIAKWMTSPTYRGVLVAVGDAIENFLNARDALVKD